MDVVSQDFLIVTGPINPLVSFENVGWTRIKRLEYQNVPFMELHRKNQITTRKMVVGQVCRVLGFKFWQTYQRSHEFTLYISSSFSWPSINGFPKNFTKLRTQMNMYDQHNLPNNYRHETLVHFIDCIRYLRIFSLYFQPQNQNISDINPLLIV